MRKIITTVCALVLVLVASQGYSQSNNKWRMHLGYNVSAPTGSFKNDFVSKTSFRGATGEISYTFNPTFSLGLKSGYQDYYEKFDRQVYHTQGNESISAVITNSMQVVPVLINGTFSPMGGKASFIKPYLSAGAGINLVDYRQYLGEFPSSDASGVFAMQAGAGVLIPFTKVNQETGFRIGANYNYAAYKKNGISNLSSVGVNAGIVFSLK